MQEIFKDIIGYEGLYQVSNLGRVYSLPKYKHKGKFLKLFKDKRGYLYIGLRKQKKQKTFIVHRLVGIHFIPNNDNFPEINHIDGNKENNFVNNLEWVTSSENQIHAFSNGLQTITEKHRETARRTCSVNGKKNKGKIFSTRKISPEQDSEIVSKFKSGISSIKLAKEYGVSKTTILNIKNNRKYRKD